jgi:peroxiredoxin
MLNPGDKAPDFVGRDHASNTVKLADFKGKAVVLWFFPSDPVARRSLRQEVGDANTR